jgi:hypothetical protein
MNPLICAIRFTDCCDQHKQRSNILVNLITVGTIPGSYFLHCLYSAIEMALMETNDDVHLSADSLKLPIQYLAIHPKVKDFGYCGAFYNFHS